MDILKNIVFFKDLSDAFRDSSGYLTWAFFSLIAIYLIWIALRDQQNKNLSNKNLRFFAVLVSIIFCLIYAFNIISIAILFEKPLGKLSYVLVMLVCSAVLIINTYPILSGLNQKLKNEE